MATFVIKEHSAELFTRQIKNHFDQLADYYFEKFNEIKRTGRYPARYMSAADAMRDCQYLTERFKIYSFEMTDDAGRDW